MKAEDPVEVRAKKFAKDVYIHEKAPGYYQTMSNLAKSQIQSHLKRSLKAGIEDIVLEDRESRSPGGESASPVKKLQLPKKEFGNQGVNSVRFS